MFDNLINTIKQRVAPVTQAVKNDFSTAVSAASQVFPSVNNFVQKQITNYQQKQANQMAEKAFKTVAKAYFDVSANPQNPVARTLDNFKIPMSTPLIPNKSLDIPVGSMVKNQIFRPYDPVEANYLNGPMTPEKQKYVQDKSLETIMALGVNAPESVRPEIKTNFFKPKGSNQADFIADAGGVVNKVKELGKKKLNELLPPASTEVASGETKLLPAGNPPKPPVSLPTGELTPQSDLKMTMTAMKDLVKNTKKELFKPVSQVKATLNNLFGDKALRGDRGTLSNTGEIGKTIVNIVDKTEEKAALMAGQYNNTLRSAFKKLIDDELMTLSDVIEGKAQALSPAQAETASLVKTTMQEIRYLAKSVGIKMGEIKDYFPHFFNDKGRIALDESYFIDRGSDINYGNLVKSREGSRTDYIKNPEVIFDYINHAVDNIVKKAAYGQGDKNLFDLAAKSGSQQATQLVTNILNKGRQGGEGLSRALTSAQQATKLGLTSPLTNLTQQFSTLERTDLPTMVKTYHDLIVNPEKAIQETIKAGEMEPSIGRAVLKQLGESKAKTIGGKWLDMIRFSLSEQANRIVSVNAGKNFATKLLSQAKNGSQAAIRELERLGITDFANTTEKDLLKAGRNTSLQTQFSTKKGELPGGWETPLGKVVTQFKSFAYKQSGFIKDNSIRIFQEAKAGNLAPLSTLLFSLAVPRALAGEIINDVKSLLYNKKRDDAGAQRYINDIVAASSLGLLDNTGGLLGQFGEGGVLSSVGGPTVGDVYNLGAKPIADANAGLSDYDPKKSFFENVDPNKTTARNWIKEIPGIGRTISNTLVPNAAVTNYVGTNNGMNLTDKKTYESLLSSGNAQAAEEFKASHQFLDNQKKNGTGFLQTMFGKKEVTLPTNPTPAQISETNTQIDAIVKNGGVPTPEQIKFRYFRNAPKDVKSSTKVLTTVKGIYDDPEAPQELKDAVLKASGLNPDDFQYYQAASLDNSEKQQLLVRAAYQQDRNSVMLTLALAKRMVGGKALATNSEIDYLYNQGLISKDEKKLLDNLKFDETKNQFYMDRDYAAGGGITYTQAKKMYKTPKLKLPKSTSSLTKVMDTKAPKLPIINYSTMPKAKRPIGAK